MISQESPTFFLKTALEMKRVATARTSRRSTAVNGSRFGFGGTRATDSAEYTEGTR